MEEDAHGSRYEYQPDRIDFSGPERVQCRKEDCHRQEIDGDPTDWLSRRIGIRLPQRAPVQPQQSKPRLPDGARRGFLHDFDVAVLVVGPCQNQRKDDRRRDRYECRDNCAGETTHFCPDESRRIDGDRTRVICDIVMMSVYSCIVSQP